MGYRYIALVDSGDASADESVHEASLRAMDMRLVCKYGPVSVFVSKATPTLSIPSGVLIGHVFTTNDGTPVTQATFPPCPAHEQLQHLLEHCWGEYLLIQFAAGDDRTIEVLRDPSGGVPCVYSIQAGSGFITSDISLATTLGLHDRQVDWHFVSHALVYPHLKAQRTGLSGVQELLPGHSLLCQRMGTATREAWTPWTFASKEHRHRNPTSAREDVREAVHSTVKAWAETDGSILLELSGGLDSSIIAACLRSTSVSVTCCTLITPVPGADERQYASQMSTGLGVALQAEELRFDDAQFDFAVPVDSVTPRVSMLQFASNEVMERVCIQHEVASVFSGGGGDSVFSYLRNAVPAADAFKEQGIAAGIEAIHNLSAMHGCTFWKAGRFTLRKLAHGSKPPYQPDRSFLSSLVDAKAEVHPWFQVPPHALPGDRERIADLAGTQLFRDSMPRGAKRWLRMPLLSQPVMEACLKVPTWMWIAGGENRAVARAAFADLLPQDILNRRSKGTFVNYSAAVYQRNKHRMRDFLLSGRLQAQGLLDADALRRFVEGDLPARDHSFMRLSELCMIENWLRHQP